LRWQKLTCSKRDMHYILQARSQERGHPLKNNNNLRKRNVKSDVYVHSSCYINLKNLWQNLLIFFRKFKKFGQNTN